MLKFQQKRKTTTYVILNLVVFIFLFFVFCVFVFCVFVFWFGCLLFRCMLSLLLAMVVLTDLRVQFVVCKIFYDCFIIVFLVFACVWVFIQKYRIRISNTQHSIFVLICLLYQNLIIKIFNQWMFKKNIDMIFFCLPVRAWYCDIVIFVWLFVLFLFLLFFVLIGLCICTY